MTIDTEYANTDFDLKSATAFDTLHSELDRTCCVLRYTHGEDGHWHSSVESCVDSRDAATDIRAMLDAINALSPAARSELSACCLCEFNIGFHCGDTWAYVHAVPSDVVRLVADAGCSIAVTLYPTRNPDGTPMEGFDEM